MSGTPHGGAAKGAARERGRRAEPAAAAFDAYQGGETFREVGRRLGASHETVRRWILAEAQRRGAPLRARPKPRTPRRAWAVPEGLCEDYRTWRKSVARIAREMGKDSGTVARALRDQGVVRAARPPTKEERIYAAFKAGRTMPELCRQFGASRGVVSQSILRCRRRDPEPYYRRAGGRFGPAAGAP